MVNQSDLPFRRLVRRYNATLVYTQMLLPDRLLNDNDYLQLHLRGLGEPNDRPVVVQLCGNDPELVVRAGKQVQSHCDAIASRFQPRLSTRGCAGCSLWRVFAWPERLALG